MFSNIYPDICFLCRHRDCRGKCLTEVQQGLAGGSGFNGFQYQAFREYVLYVNIVRETFGHPPVPLNHAPDPRLDAVDRHSWNEQWDQRVLFGPVMQRIVNQQQSYRQVEIPPSYVHSTGDNSLVVKSNTRREWYTYNPDNPSSVSGPPYYNCDTSYPSDCDCNLHEEQRFRGADMLKARFVRGLFDSDDETEPGDADLNELSAKKSSKDEVKIEPLEQQLQVCQMRVASPVKRQRSESSESSC